MFRPRKILFHAEAARPASRRLRNALVVACVVAFAALVSSLPVARSQQQQTGTQTPQQRPRRVEPPDAQKPDDDEVLRVDTDLVLLDVAVTDDTGRPVRNLTARDFKIYDDGVERPIAFFNVERRSSGALRPVAIVFAVDVSGSMTPNEMERLASAMQLFSRRLSDRSSVFAVMSFGMSARVLQPFTSDQQKLERAFARLAREANGLSTHTYDAVDDAIRLLTRHAPRTRDKRLMKRAVVVVTDGFPVGDTVAPKTVIERANAAEVSVYTVTLPSFSRFLTSRASGSGRANAHAPLPTPLDVSELAEKTGGSNVYATERDFGPLFQMLAEEVTSSYILAFYPPEEKRRDGRFHPLRVTAPPGLNVRQSRPGYGNSDK